MSKTQDGENASTSAAAPTGPKRIGFGAAILGVVGLTAVGWIALEVLSSHWRVYQQLRETHSAWDALTTLPGATADANWSDTRLLVRDVIFVAFTIFFGIFAWLSRASFTRFFRSMNVGVAVVLLATLSVVSGVLIPQIGPPDDSTVRVDAPDAPGGNYREQFDEFRWAVGYFLYHLGHLYGVGMPEADIPPAAIAGLDGFSRKYGLEEAGNRRKGMEAAFSGNAKTLAIEDFTIRNEKRLRSAFDLVTRLHLNRVYRSFWFASLLTVLAVAIVFNTFHGGPKRWLKPSKFGFFLVHVGMLVLLTGGALSRTFTVRGICNLHLGGLDRNGDGVYDRSRDEMPPVEDGFYRSNIPDAEHLRFMPFGLSLEAFARRDWPALQVTFLDEEGVPLAFKSRLPTYTLWNGREIDLDYVDPPDGSGGDPEPRLRLIVRALHERATVAGVVTRERTAAERGDGPASPVAELRVPDARRIDPSRIGEAVPSRQEFLFAAAPGSSDVDCVSDLTAKFRLVAVREGDPTVRFPGREGRLGACYVRTLVEGENVDERIDVRLGEVNELPGGYRIVFQRATKWYQTDPRTGTEIEIGIPLAQQPLMNPAVVALVTAPDGRSESRVLQDGVDPMERKLVDSYDVPEVLLTLDWDDWTAPGGARYVLTWDANDRATLISQDGDRTDVALGERLPMEGMPVELVDVFDDFAYEADVRFRDPIVRDDGWNEEFYSRDPRGLELEIVHWPEDARRRTSEIVSMASTRAGAAGIHIDRESAFVLEFFENTAGFPFEWRSVLRVHERDASGNWVEKDLGDPRSREIRVNDYFFYKGYRMFQTNANETMPGYSGIGVVFDPGIPLAIAGMWIVIAGAAFAFLVRPILLARGRGNRGAVPTRQG
ncbi:MAG: hypothetical protein R3F34_15200 [Planctomycetota bacterium]